MSSIDEIDGVLEASDMLGLLTRGYEQVANTCREALALALAQQGNGESSAALISDRMRVHEKTAWMLRAVQ